MLFISYKNEMIALCYGWASFVSWQTIFVDSIRQWTSLNKVQYEYTIVLIVKKMGLYFSELRSKISTDPDYNLKFS